MKKSFFFIFLFFTFYTSHSQDNPPHKFFFRLYADNDALVPSNHATDWGYTSGNRIDFFYTTPESRSNFFTLFNKLAGPDPVRTKGWGMMQMIIAPQKTSLTIPDQNDYPYSGALFAIHTIHSANPVKQINCRSEWVVGLMGPPSFAKETQAFFHQLIKDPPPMGWGHQLPTDLLLNYNLKAEKLLAGNKNIGLAGGGEFFCGSMKDGLSLHLLFQIGNNRNYFSGLTNQYFTTKKSNLSVSLRSSADLVLYDALLEGGIFNSKSPVHTSNSKYGSNLKRQKINGSLELFILFSMKKIAASFTQKMVSTEFRGYGSHTIGNISTFFSW
jgi:lipid A 3-O-deacylase